MHHTGFCASTPYELTLTDNESCEPVFLARENGAGSKYIFWNCQFKKGISQTEVDQENGIKLWIVARSGKNWKECLVEVKNENWVDTIRINRINFKLVSSNMENELLWNRLRTTGIWFSHLLCLCFLGGLIYRMWKWKV